MAGKGKAKNGKVTIPEKKMGKVYGRAPNPNASPVAQARAASRARPAAKTKAMKKAGRTRK